MTDLSFTKPRAVCLIGQPHAKARPPGQPTGCLACQPTPWLPPGRGLPSYFWAVPESVLPPIPCRARGSRDPSSLSAPPAGPEEAGDPRVQLPAAPSPLPPFPPQGPRKWDPSSPAAAPGHLAFNLTCSPCSSCVSLVLQTPTETQASM